MSYLGNSVQRWKISAARDVGGFTLLWIDFPGVADGGAFLVYDQETCHIRWEFKGGELG